jgi:ankyrin repeat protein
LVVKLSIDNNQSTNKKTPKKITKQSKAVSTATKPKHRRLTFALMAAHCRKFVASDAALALMAVVDRSNSAVAVEKWLTEHGDADNVVNAVVNGRTPLHAAIVRDNEQLCRVLLRHGAELVAARGQKAPLSLAAQHGSSHIVAALLEFGALRHDDDGDALLEAVRGKHADVAALLLNAGANPNAHQYLFMAVNLHDIETCRILLRAGADAAHVSLRQSLPLHVAAANKDYDIFRLLLGAECAPRCINMRDGAGWTAFQLALWYGAPTPVALECLQRGADVDCIAPNGFTTALLATQRSPVAVVRAIVERNPALIETAALSSADSTPLRIAVLALHSDTVRFLLACGVEVPPVLLRLTIDGISPMLQAFSPAAAESPRNESTDVAAVAKARRDVLAVRHTLFRRIATTACIAMHELDLPAWVMLAVVDELAPLGRCCEPLHVRWKLVCLVKHFRDTKKK